MRNVYILDPVCAQSIGHNLKALQAFGKFFNYCNINETLYGSELLNNTVSNKDHLGTVIPYFPFTYKNELKLFDNSGNFYECSDKNLDDLTHSFNKLFESLPPNPEEKGYIFFPSVDIDSLRSLTRLSLQARSILRAYTIIFRFINVMENARSTTRDSLSRQVKKIIELHPDTILCAETNNYSQYLEELFLCKVYRLAHPVTTYSPAATRQSVRLKICCPGSNRADKGYSELPEIINSVNSCIGLNDIEWDIQDVPKAQLSEDLVHAWIQLSRIPNCHLKDAYLPEDELKSMMSSSSIILMPYDKTTYKLRGSAILPESMSLGIPVVTYSGCGFSDDISRNHAGLLATSKIELVAYLKLLAKSYLESPSNSNSIYEQLKKNTKNYVQDSSKTLEIILNQ